MFYFPGPTGVIFCSMVTSLKGVMVKGLLSYTCCNRRVIWYWICRSPISHSSDLSHTLIYYHACLSFLWQCALGRCLCIPHLILRLDFSTRFLVVLFPSTTAEQQKLILSISVTLKYFVKLDKLVLMNLWHTLS